MKSYSRLYFQLISAAIFIVPKAANGSTVRLDTLLVSTISASSNSGTITIASAASITSGGSLNLSGSGGYIIGASSIIASAFFGDASHLSGLAIENATQTWTGANTFLSTFSVRSNGRQIIFSTGSTTNNILLDQNGNISFYPSLHNSSSTVIPQGSTTDTTFGPCLAGSTLTITTSGGRVEVLFSGTIINITGGSFGNPAAASFLQDGQFARNLSPTIAIVRGGAGIDVGPFRYLLDAPSPGVHSYCLTLAAPAGGGGTTSINETANFTNFFYVNEIK